MKHLFWLIFFPIMAITSPPEVIVFDYGGVMADAHYQPIFQYLSRTLSISYPKIKNDFSYDKLKGALYQPKEFWEQYSGKTLDAKWMADFQKNRKSLIKHIKGVKPIVEELKEMGYRLALLSNTGKSRAAFLRSMGEYDLFDLVVVSCDFNTKKPHREIYQILLDQLGVKAESCLFIDDKKRNVKAARFEGMDGIVFHNAEDLRKELIKREIALRPQAEKGREK